MIKEISRKGAKAQRPVIWNHKVHKGHKEKKRFLKYFCFFLRVHCVLSSLNVILLAALRLCVRHAYTPLAIFVSFCGFLWPVPSLATLFSFDDIEFWVGSGANRAALVIDWVENDTTQPALAWGYRWDGAATGRDMLLAVVAEDDRLFAKLGDSPANPIRVFGLGYDADDDGDFGVDDGTTFDEAGIAFSSAPFFPAAATEVGDDYAEGWTFGFWHYGGASTNPYDGGNWSDSPVGMESRLLSDGAWDSWVFSPSFNFASFAENPRAAIPPIVNMPGDFNGDEIVDAADYAVWKASFGSQTQLIADANGNGVVDAADYTIWRDNLHAALNTRAAIVHSVPEPATISFAIASVSLLVRPLIRTKHR